MAKLNPLHVERIKAGEDPAKMDLAQGTGETTAHALALLAVAITNPGVPTESRRVDLYIERVEVAQVAEQLAKNAGLKHLHLVERSKIVFEYIQFD